MSETNRFSYASFSSNETNGTNPSDREELLRRMQAQQAAQQTAAGEPGHEEALRRAQAQREAAQRRMLEQQAAARAASPSPGTARRPGSIPGSAETVDFGGDDEQMLRQNRERARAQAHGDAPAQPQARPAANTAPGQRPLSAQEIAAAKAAARARHEQAVAAMKSEKQAAKAEKATYKKTASKSKDAPSSGAQGREPKKSGKKGLVIALSIVGALLVVAGALFALVYTGVLGSPKVQYYTYDVADSETLVKYLQHPALKAGDTLNITAPCRVDVVEAFGDVAVLPLVNFTGTGSVSFEGGAVLFAGGEEAASWSGLQFSGCELYVEAGHTSLTWDNPVGDSNINVASLNGAAHGRDISLLFVGGYATIPVTLQNNGGALSNVEIRLTSASCIFPEGDAYIVESLAPGASVIQVPVILTEGGRIRVSAYGVDAGGNTVVTGKSDYIRVAGDGYYAGDLHTHTAESVFDREGSLDSNVRYGYQNGMSFIFSVENRESPDETNYANRLAWEAEAELRRKEEAARAAEEAARKAEEEENAEQTGGDGTPADGTSFRQQPGADFVTLSAQAARRRSLPVTLATSVGNGDGESGDGEEDEAPSSTPFDLYPGDEYIAEQLDQATVDSLTGAPGEFLQIAAVETGYISQHMLIYGANLAPPSDYGDQFHIDDYVYGTWTFQEALNAVLEGGGIVVLPHVISRDATEGIQHAFSLRGMTAIEVVSIGQKADETGGVIERNIWNCINTRGGQKLFVVMSSNNYNSSEVGTSFIKGHMNTLSEQAILELLRSGEFIASNGPEVRFTMGGHVMGGEITLPQEAAQEPAEGEDGAQPETAANTTVKARIYAADDAPLTEVRLLRYTITGSIDNVLEEVVFSQTFTGDVYSFTTEQEVTLQPGEFYRVEVRSRTSDLGDDIGLGLSNPIWVAEDRTLQNSTNIQSIELKGGAQLMTAPNGALYIKADRFNAGMIDLLTDGKATSVTYHHYDSALIADKITIQITASDATQTTETIYLVK